MNLVRYEAACRAVAEVKSIDEAKDWRDKAEGLRAYARQANNRQLEIDAAEIRMRAERRLGELIRAQKETVGLAPPGPAKKIGSVLDPISTPTLAAAGIGKHLADRARKMAAVPEGRFEEALGGGAGASRTPGQENRVRFGPDFYFAHQEPSAQISVLRRNTRPQWQMLVNRAAQRQQVRRNAHPSTP